MSDFVEHRVVKLTDYDKCDWSDKSGWVANLKAIWQYAEGYDRPISEVYVDGEEWDFSQSRCGVTKAFLDAETRFEGEAIYIRT